MASSSFTPAQKKALLWIVVALAALRFLGMPLLDYQEQQKQDLGMTTAQLERAQRLLDAEGSTEALAEMRQQRERIESNFIRHATDSEFRLQAQQRMQQVFQQNNLQVNLFDWLAREDRFDGYLRVHQARIDLQGVTPDMVRAQLQLIESMPGVKILEYTLQSQAQTRAQRQRGQSQQGRLNLLVEVAGVRAGERS